jgi:hypothetical protein
MLRTHLSSGAGTIGQFGGRRTNWTRRQSHPTKLKQIYSSTPKEEAAGLRKVTPCLIKWHGAISQRTVILNNKLFQFMS